MHRLPSKNILWRLRLVSCFLILEALALPIAFVFLAFGISHRDHQALMISGCLFMVAILLVISNKVMTPILRCPLCTVSPMQNRGCAKHRNVRRLMGSHRLRVATTILACGYFTCPYCDEKTAMKVRSKRMKSR